MGNHICNMVFHKLLTKLLFKESSFTVSDGHINSCEINIDDPVMAQKMNNSILNVPRRSLILYEL